jgi:alanine dehydrogenase
MLIGVPKEIKDSEYRVGLVPSTVRELTRNGHHVIVERSAGLGAGIADGDYRAVGAEIVSDADQVYGRGELIVKVKEPLAFERKKLRPGKSSSPICIWPLTRNRPPTSWHRAPSRLPTRR